MLLQHWQHALWIGMSLNRVALTFHKGQLVNDVRNISRFFRHPLIITLTQLIGTQCYCLLYGHILSPLSACERHLLMDPNTSLPLKPGHRQMGLPNVFLAGGKSDVPHYFHFCRPRQLRPDRAGRAPHSGDANAIDGQSRQTDIWLEFPIFTFDYGTFHILRFKVLDSLNPHTSTRHQ